VPGRPLLLAAGSVLDADALTLIEVAAGAGFDGVGLRATGAGGTVDRGSDLWRACADRATELGIAVHDVEVHRLAMGCPDPGPLLDAAATLGARAVLAVSDDPDVGVSERLLAAFAERCRAAGLVPALEYMAWTTPSTPDLAAEVAATTGCVVVADLLHHHRVGAGPGELAGLAASGTLGWVQLCDAPTTAPADLVHEARHARLSPGRGELPLAELLAAVPADVAVSVEVQSDELSRHPPHERARLLADAARRVLSDR
jgi:sugar phosphate isomerase/epimerase